MIAAGVRTGVLCLAVLVGIAGVASAQDPYQPQLTATVSGSTVTLTWTAVPGATAYLVEAQVSGGQVIAQPVGGTSVSLPNVPPGSYLARVRGTRGALQGPPSNVANITVAPPSAPALPPTPANLGATVNGTSVLLSWDVDTSAISALVVQAGTTPGGSDLGTHFVRVSTSTYLPSVPPGTYYVRMASVGAGGVSAPSKDLVITTPGCTAPPAIPLSLTTAGSYVSASWPEVPGATGYLLEVSSAPGGGPDVLAQPFGPGQTHASAVGIAEGDYYVTLKTQLSCGAQAQSAQQHLKVTPAAHLPAKSFAQAHAMVVEATLAMAAQYPGDLRNSCGNETWVFRVLQRLRSQDDRFGLNWKRGVPGSMSDDVVVYNDSDVPNEVATAPHLMAWDIIGGHCGPRPYPVQNYSITNRNGQAAWTILPYLQAGFAP